MATVLWHIPVSHFSEKVHWALDLKRVEHERRAPLPPAHMAVALALTRGRAATLPVLTIGGRAVADSSEIIAELERLHPEPPLYPMDAGQRTRALALARHFDEELGPAARHLAFHELRRDAAALERFTASMLPGALGASATVTRLAARGTAAFSGARYRVGSDEAAERARAKILAAFDRVERELARGAGTYLAGDAFSVADLTAASLFVPVVRPPEGPALPAPPPAFVAFQDTVRDRPGWRWVLETFARHRRAARRP